VGRVCSKGIGVGAMTGVEGITASPPQPAARKPTKIMRRRNLTVIIISLVPRRLYLCPSIDVKEVYSREKWTRLEAVHKQLSLPLG
jgi:hypothetical protein